MRSTQECLNYYSQRHDVSILDHAIVMDSGVVGPHVIIVGGIHGHEPVGVHASIEYVEHIEKNNILLRKGKITWLLGNPIAFSRSQRFVDVNMNRAFEVLLEDTIEHRRVKSIRGYLHSDRESSSQTYNSGEVSESPLYMLDLHSVSSGDFRIAICLNEYPDYYEKLCSLTELNTHFTCSRSEVPGTILQEAVDFGGFGYVIECGNNSDPEARHVALWHINKLLQSTGLLHSKNLIQTKHLKGDLTNTHYSYLETIKTGYSFEWKIPTDDIYTGKHLSMGQLVATVENQNIYAPEDCVLFIPDRNPKPEDHDAGFFASVTILPHKDFARNKPLQHKLSANQKR